MAADRPAPGPQLLKRAEIAAKFKVSPYTVDRWARRGLLTAIRTPGGRRRYSAVQVRALLAGGGQ